MHALLSSSPSKEREIFRRNNSEMPRMLRYVSPKFEGCFLPEMDIRSTHPAEYVLLKKVRLAANAVSNFADATSCVHVRVAQQMRTYVHTRYRNAARMHRSSMQHYGPACRCCTMEDLGHPKTVARAAPGEFLVFVTLKNHTGGKKSERQRIVFAKRLFRKIRRICEKAQRKSERTSRLILGKIRWRIKWVAREVKIITPCPENNKVRRINGYTGYILYIKLS